MSLSSRPATACAPSVAASGAASGATCNATSRGAPLAGGLLDLSAARHGHAWGDWRELTSDAAPFLSPEFFALVSPLVEKDGAASSLLLAGAWRGERMVGALPLVQRGRVFHPLSTDYSPEYDYCGTQEGLEAIWSALRRDSRWDELVFDSVPRDSLLATRLPLMAWAAGCPSVLRPRHRHPYFKLPGFAARLSPKFRTNLERCARKAGAELERLTAPTRTDLDEALRIEALAWKDAAGTSIKSDARVAHLYRAVTRLWGRRGRAALYFLRSGGERIATLFAVEDARTLYALKIGYDPRHANLSPGHLIVWLVSAEAETRGLTELNFVGHEDEWKRKWTELGHEHTTVIVYRRSPQGLGRYLLREHIKPRIPARLRAGRHGVLAGGCQRTDFIGEHTLMGRWHARLGRGLGVRSRLRAAVLRTPARPHLGEPSRFPVGSWVRVLDLPRLSATLDARSQLRGLTAVPTQLETCGKVYRVQRHVRRIRTDNGLYRPIVRTVLLEGIDCGGDHAEPAGCGRHCPLMYRDEWLEPSPAPASTRHPPAADTRPRARVRQLEEIVAGLDPFGRRGGLSFMPEMQAYAGRRLPVAARLPQVYEDDRWTAPPQPIYLLDGASCQGTTCGADGPCDRGCMLLWHEDWLLIDRP